MLLLSSSLLLLVNSVTAACVTIVPCIYAVAGIPAVAGVPSVPDVLTVAGLPAVTGVPAVCFLQGCGSAFFLIADPDCGSRIRIQGLIT